MFRRTKKVVKGTVKAVRLGAFIATIAKAGLWVYSLAKKPQTQKTKTAAKKRQRK